MYIHNTVYSSNILYDEIIQEQGIMNMIVLHVHNYILNTRFGSMHA